MPASVMTKSVLRRTLCAVAAASLLAAPALAAAPLALTRSDAAIYQAAFAAVRTGDFKTADKRLKKADDRSLIGYVELEKLMRPGGAASFAQLTSWLDKYGDLPGAERVYALAQKRQPANADLGAPAVLNLIRDVAERGLALVGMPSPAAKSAFYGGDAETAFKLAAQSSERWIAGLSAFRLGRFADARTYFDAVAMDGAQDEWLRAGGAYWAARSAIADGAPELATNYLSAAAQMPWTFYGMLAEAQLGLDPSARFDGPTAPTLRPVADAMTAMLIRVSTAAQPIRALAPQPYAANASASDDADAERLVRSDSRARRAAALMQLGRMTEAAREIELGLAECSNVDSQRAWAALGQQLAIPADNVRAPALGGFDPADYPTPVLNPKDGFTLDPALVYAIVRQESRFNPDAVSRAGAVGLMQLMPSTAAQVTGDRVRRDALRDPANNLRLGQDYFVWLLQHGVGDDLLAAVAAYNAGPGGPLKTQAQLGTDTDSLMMIESLPAQETRNYVERVMANYWLYRRQFGAPTASLQALASGGARVSAALEHAVTPPGPPVYAQPPAAEVSLAATAPLEGHD